jgi:hypothetical protein
VVVVDWHDFPSPLFLSSPSFLPLLLSLSLSLCIPSFLPVCGGVLAGVTPPPTPHKHHNRGGGVVVAMTWWWRLGDAVVVLAL